MLTTTTTTTTPVDEEAAAITLTTKMEAKRRRHPLDSVGRVRFCQKLRRHSALLVAFLTLLLLPTRTLANMNPCHSRNNVKLKPSTNCTKIIVPNGFCNACSIGEITPTGHYVDCRKTMAMETPACLAMIPIYLALNPCDTARITAWNEYQNGNAATRELGLQKLDYYAYSVCEQSCDCIPQVNAVPDQRIVHTGRGNCPAHTFYDICRVLPKVKLIIGEGTTNDDVTSYPEACVGVGNWFRSPASNNWGQNPNTPLEPAITYFLDRLVESTELTKPASTLWDECFHLETSQRRITQAEPDWNTIATNGNPISRHEACFVSVGQKGYLLGGRSAVGVSVYDFRTRSWSNLPRTLDVVLHHAQCVVLDGKIWMVGAWTGRFPSEPNADKFYVYDPATNSWDDTRAIMSDQRNRGSAAVTLYNGEIYVSHGNRGGHNTGALVLGLFDVYNPATNTWRALPDAPNPRDHTGGGILTDSSGDTLFCVSGGRDSSHPVFFNEFVLPTDCYNFQSEEWEVRASIPTPRAGSAYGITCDGRLMVAGGEGNDVAWDTVEVFNGEVWETFPSLKTARHGTGLAMDCGCSQIHIASGSGTQGASNLASTETFFLQGVDESCSSSPIPVPTNSPPPPTPAVPTMPPTITQVVNNETSTVPSPIAIAPTAAPLTQPTSNPVEVSDFSLFINAGQNNQDVTDGSGSTWVSDRYANRGNLFKTKLNNPILSMPNPGMEEVYRSSRWFSGTDFTYTIPSLEPALYQVRLHFAEVYQPAQSVGSRRFNVEIQGSPVLTDFDIFLEAGSFTALVREFTVLVDSGQLAITFVKGLAENPMITAIEIRVAPTTPNPTDVPSWFPSNAPSETPSISFEPTSLSSAPTSVPSLAPSIRGAPISVSSSASPVVPSQFPIESGPEPYQLFINVGGTVDTLDGLGRQWVRDQYGTPAQSFTMPNSAISNMAASGMETIYRQQKWLSGAFTYTIPDLISGSYLVKLHFVEGFSGAFKVGARKFNVILQGTTVLADFDVFKEAGGSYAAVSRQFVAVVNAGTIAITFAKGGSNNPTVSAIEIQSLSSTQAPMGLPTSIPSGAPTRIDSAVPTADNSNRPSQQPSKSTSVSPSVNPSISSGPSTNSVSPSAVGSILTPNTVSAAPTTTPSIPRFPSLQPSNIPISSPEFQMRVSVGSNIDVVDGNGNTWLADSPYCTGKVYRVGDEIAGTQLGQQEVYRSQRWENGAMSCVVPNLSAGAYEVRLHFSENYGPNMNAGRRLFDVSLQGRLVLGNFDIFTEAGLGLTAVIRQFDVSVDQTGTLTAIFSKGMIENPTVSAIEILSIREPAIQMPSLSPITADSFPSQAPSEEFSALPSSRPSLSPSAAMSLSPTGRPSNVPGNGDSSIVDSSEIPSESPPTSASASTTSPLSNSSSALPSETESHFPSVAPSKSRGASPAVSESYIPSVVPSENPSVSPIVRESYIPSVGPSESPNGSPFRMESHFPSVVPSEAPSVSPAVSESFIPSVGPSNSPSGSPSGMESPVPSVGPSDIPSGSPSVMDSQVPSVAPSKKPSVSPSVSESHFPSVVPSDIPSGSPSGADSLLPSVMPSSSPSESPSVSTIPSVGPSDSPTES